MNYVTHIAGSGAPPVQVQTGAKTPRDVNVIVDDPDTLAKANVKVKEFIDRHEPLLSRSYTQVIKDASGSEIANRTRTITLFEDKDSGKTADALLLTFKAEALRGSGGRELWLKEGGRWVRYNDGTLDGKINVESVAFGSSVKGDIREFPSVPLVLKDIVLNVLGSPTKDYVVADLAYTDTSLRMKATRYNGETHAGTPADAAYAAPISRLPWAGRFS